MTASLWRALQWSSRRTGLTNPSGFTVATEQGNFLSTRSAVFPMSIPEMPPRATVPMTSISIPSDTTNSGMTSCGSPRRSTVALASNLPSNDRAIRVSEEPARCRAFSRYAANSSSTAYLRTARSANGTHACNNVGESDSRQLAIKSANSTTFRFSACMSRSSELASIAQAIRGIVAGCPWRTSNTGHGHFRRSSMSTAPNPPGPEVARSRACDRRTKSWFDRNTSSINAVAGRPTRSIGCARTSFTCFAIRASCRRRSSTRRSSIPAGK